MKHYIIFAWSLALSVLLTSMTGKAIGAEALSVERYCKISRSRLAFVLKLRKSERRNPNALEESLFLQTHGVDWEEYHAFASAHSQEVNAYLGAHPKLQAEIERLSARIHALIQQVEGQ